MPLKIIWILTNILLMVAGVLVYGTTHEMGFWILGTAWLPLLVAAFVVGSQYASLPNDPAKMARLALLPFLLTGASIAMGNLTLAEAVMTGGIITLAGVMVGHALFAVVFPIKHKMVDNVSTFINEEVIPQSFAFLPGILLPAFALWQLYRDGTYDTLALTSVALSIAIDGWIIGKTLFAHSRLHITE